MAKNVTIAGASYSGVPSINVPQTGGGTATFYDCVGSKSITENGTVDVTGLASVAVNVAGGGGGLPSGIAAIDFGTYTVTSDFTTTGQTVQHNLGVEPDMVMFWHNGNIATAYSMLFAIRSKQMGYRSSAYNVFYGSHANTTTSVSIGQGNNTTAGVGSMTASSFKVQSFSTSYYWRAGTYNWLAIKFA